MDTRRAVKNWIDTYTRAWYRRDPKPIVSLFSEDAVYRSHPFRDPHVGETGVLTYTTQALEEEQNVYSISFGEPIVDGSRAAVEYWVTMREKEKDVTFAGFVLLRFATDGKCKELRDYWAMEPGRREPPSGWSRDEP